MTVFPENCKLVIQVNRAYNVPSLRDLRRAAQIQASSAQDDEDELLDMQVSPQV